MAGSNQQVTITKKQAKDAAKAIGDLLSLLSEFPTSISDFLPRKKLENIYRSQCLLDGRPYDPSDYFNDDTEDDEE